MAMAATYSMRMLLLGVLALTPLIVAQPRILSFTPRSGSLRGATRLTITGSDFSKDPFSYGIGNEHKGNQVYLRNSTASIKCDGLPYWSNKERIICDTRAAAAGWYSLYLTVDGVEITQQGGSYCNGNSYWCSFEYRDQRTPQLHTVTPSAGTPGTLVNLRGKIFTDQYSPQQNAENELDVKTEIQRVYWGDYLGDLTDPVTGDLYGISLDNDGSPTGDQLRSNLKAPSWVTSQKFTVLISPYGRSQARIDSLMVSALNELYNYQTHAEITGVEPSTGSLEGGTLLTIYGNYFYDRAETTVLAEGVPCDVQSISDTVITCITNKGADTNRKTYPGSRGILWERWITQNNLDTADFDTSSEDYVTPKVLLNGISPEASADNSVGRMRGYFVPPRDGEYRFWIRGVGENQLFFSKSGDETDMEIICYSRAYARWWTSFIEQKSDSMSLKAGKPYYFEARNSEGDWVEIGVDFFDVPIAAGPINGVTDEKQQVRVYTTVQPDIQFIRFLDDNEVQDFKFDYGGVESSPLSSTSSEEEVQAALDEMFSVGCSRNGNPSTIFSRDFETPLEHGSESGQRVSDDLPYCGRKSLENPGWIYVEGETADDDGEDVDAFRVDKMKLCFAFRGKIGYSIQLSFRYINTFYEQVENEDWYASEELEAYEGYTDEWEHACIDLDDMASNQGWITDDAFGALYVTGIKLPEPDEDNPLYIDNVYIGSSDDAWTRTKAPASPDDIHISAFSVTKVDLGFDIEMTPANCGYGLPLLGFQDSSIISGSAESNSDEVYYSSGGSTVRVNRVFMATIPVSGSFVLSSNDREVEVSTSTSASQMKAALESFLDTGTVVVSKEGNCYDTRWEVEWKTRGGRQPLLQINKKDLEGTDVMTEVTRLDEGRLFMGPIPGEFSRLPYDEPQVEVMVNHIPSSCAANASCAFSYDAASTPEIDSVSPTSGSQFEGTAITISGSGFSDDVTENNVTIGGVVCDVTSASESEIVCDVGPGTAGNYTVEVNVPTKGFAAYPNGDVQFEYETDVIDVDPENGSAIGGIQVTISGYGFPCIDGTPDNVMVAVGDKNCKILSICYDEIVCKIALGGVGDGGSFAANVELSIDDDVVARGEDPFVFDDSLPTLSISDFNPKNVSIGLFGGGNLTITGSGFGDSGATVNLGDAECEVISQSNTEIMCSIPPNNPGAYDIEVSVDDQDYADPSSVDQFVYALQVTSMTPDIGSLAGGTKVMITGAGFGDDASEVSIEFSDTITCEIESIADDQIECVIDIDSTVHDVDNMGKHESLGTGYKWNPQFLDIRVYDIVSWQWGPPHLTYGISYTVQQSADSDSTSYDGSGFYAGSASADGSYAYRFTAPGICYYSSTDVNGDGVYMKGVVKVGAQPSGALVLSLSVGDYEAEYFTDNDVKVEFEECSPDTNPIENCTTLQPPTSNDNGTFQFAFWDCFTPVITDISPNQGQPDAVITLTGYGFGTETCQNQITINDHNCVPQSANDTHVECVIDTEDNFPVGNYDLVSMSVFGKGNVINAVTSPVSRTFRMVPHITGFSQQEGSMEGGTRLEIYGDGFSADSIDDISITIGGGECLIESFDYTTLVCVTSKPDSPGTYTPELIINDVDAVYAVTSQYRQFRFVASSTPNVTSVSPATLSGESTTITIEGSGFGDDTDSNAAANVTVTIGGANCEVTSAVDDEIICDVGYVPVGDAPVVVNVEGAGNSAFGDTSRATLYSNATIDGVDPVSGSLEGGQEVTIVGNGFQGGDTTVDIGGSECTIQSMNISQIVCTTTSHSTEAVDLVVTSGGISYPAESYEYAEKYTPTILSVTPTSGSSGDSISIGGSGFSNTDAENRVTINGVECSITSSGATRLECDVGVHSAGTYTVIVHVLGKGYATSSTKFEYSLGTSRVTPSQGSFGGGAVVIEGTGFSTEDDTRVTICGNVCQIIHISESVIEVDVPQSSGTAETRDCDIVVTLDSGAIATVSSGWQYCKDLTPVIDRIDPTRGGTGGGTTLTISGNGFAVSDNKVYIAGTECTINEESSTEIVCRTGAHSPSIEAKVRVEVPNKGVAASDNKNYYYRYVDVWSSKYTWGGYDPPIEGDFVIVPAGQTLLMDTTTLTLKMLLIQGGKVIFDEVDQTLNAEYILITDGGLLQVGTEDEPFQHQATLMMHGNARSKELPMYGAKTLAVRNGTLELHGKYIPVTWTYLADTINAGDTTMTLKEPVTWENGDQIVVAATSDRFGQAENEEFTITDISDDGKTLTFEPAVKYEHISVVQDIEGVFLETRAEVGLLTRNVVVRGSVQEDWTETIEACEKEFDPNQFAVQTCFRGKFGEELASDQFGSAIMLFAKEPDKDLATGRLSYIEVTHAGQASRLGRYAIHYHLNGNVTGNYVRGCAIHHTFNRAVTLHGVHHLLVEHNVAYNIMGHAFFLEDGIETKNEIQYNLAIFVRSSNSLLNVDVTPAAYWVTNPDNYIRHNNAAGGSHFGFWYRLPEHPEGPSFTSSICPRNIPLLEFYNNTAHNMGWYGIWIFPVYTPMKGGGCGSSVSEPAEYYNLTAWHVERGAEAVSVGAIQFINFLIPDATASGLEYQTSWDEWGGPMIKDSVIIAHSDIAANEAACTNVGVQLPKSKYMTVDGVKFINFDMEGCAAIGACGHCKARQGGFESRSQNLGFYKSPNRVRWQWEHEAWLVDLDGSLTGNADYTVLPYNPNLPPDHCEWGDPEFGSSDLPGAVCDDTISFHRLAFNRVQPTSLEAKWAVFENDYGVSRIPFKKKRITHPYGWMVTLIDGDNYRWFFENRDHLTNISYDATFYDFSDGEYVLINHEFTQRPDAFSITGDIRNGTESVPTYDDDEHGDWNFDNSSKIFTYLISGKGHSSEAEFNVNLDVYRCFYKDCISPIPIPPYDNTANLSGRPDNVLLWSETETWEYQPEGWGSNTGDGSYTGALPQDGEDVMILPGTYVVADITDLPVMKKLFIYGVLELGDDRDYKLTATYILIQGGRLIIGWSEEQPFTHNVHIVLQGNHETPDIPLPLGPNLGSKAIGSFGGLDIHGQNRSVYWTHLAKAVTSGDDTITVEEDTDWEEGDEIMVTSTTYEPWHTETFKIISVTGARTLTLNATFQHYHAAGDHTVTDGEVTYTYGLKADVALLTRNIKIEGADYDDLIEESFGSRLIVGRFFQNGEMYQGYGRISNVEFLHSGQEGWTDSFDPRYSVAFLDTGESTGAQLSYVTGCSFHSGFSSAIGLFGAQGVLIKDNVIHHTVGSAVVDEGTANRFIHNLVAVKIAPGTYLDRHEKENLHFTGGFEVDQATSPILINNTVAGSEKFGFQIKGEPCDEKGTWSGNVVHSTWMGVVLVKNHRECSKVANFEVYKCGSYGIYAQISSSLLVSGVKMADNKNGIMPMIVSPPSLSHINGDKFVRIENSLIVGMSPDYQCDGDDDIAPEAAGLPKQHPSKLAPSGGHIGIKWPTFMSSKVSIPFFGFDSMMSYPQIGGRTEVDNVMFHNFQTNCGNRQHKVISTHTGNVDAFHPMMTSNIQLVDVDKANIMRLNRPTLGEVNPSDCVDMDCDGLKKAMLRDLDGTLLGSVGTILPDSAFEWDGDPHRGLGDYRIPPVMVTDLDGSKIPYEDKMPNKGIYRGQDNECEWRDEWTAYECHGIDHMMMVVESLDADTEVRRLSPVGLYTDTYIDLINGPQDNGWCHGYTCQERISTFYTIVATGMSYELVFSSKNPQKLRYQMLHADDTQKVVVGTYYTDPQRLDVYVNGQYVMPSNGAMEDGELVWKNDLEPEEYKPDPSSIVYGDNFFHRDESTLYILIRGSDAVDVVTTPVIMVTFGVPAIAVEDFFEKNVINNLVQFLDVKPSQIRIVEIIAEDSKRRRRATSEAEVVLEIGDPPADSIEPEESLLTGTPMTTEAPPTTTPSGNTESGNTEAPSSGSALNFDALVSIQSTIANEMQKGTLGDALDVPITSLAMTDPAETPTDPTGGVRATNETSGASDGTLTYAEQQAAAAEEESETAAVVVYRIPTQLVLHTEPSGAVEGEEFTGQPNVQVLDASGITVTQLGTKSNPWQLTASIRIGSGSIYGDILGNTTLPFENGWVNFTDLIIDSAESDYILDFTITYPNASTLTVSSQSFDVDGREYYAAVVTSPGVANISKSFDVVVEIRDGESMLAVTDLDKKGFVWHAMASLYYPDNYAGQLVGNVDVTFDLSKAQAHFNYLSISAAGYQYILELQVITVPRSAYNFSVVTEPFDVVDPEVVVHTGEPSSLTIVFNADYDAVVAGKETHFTAIFINNFAPRYPNVTISNVAVSKGAIIVTFDIQGDVNDTQAQMADDVSNGDIVFNFDGDVLSPSAIMLPDGELVTAPMITTTSPTSLPASSSSSSSFPIWVIPVALVIAILLVIIIVLIVYRTMIRSDGKLSSEAMPLQESPRETMRVESVASFNKAYDGDDRSATTSLSSSDPELQCLNEDTNTIKDLSIHMKNSLDSAGFMAMRVSTPNTPRRTPEVVVSALPPGFADEQEERVLEDRQSMYLMAKNHEGTFLKLGVISANLVGTIYHLRQDIMRIFSNNLKDKKFVMMRETLKDIDGNLEKKLSVSEVYSSDCILIRFVNETDEEQMCVCGLLGQFKCSLCKKQSYCSPGCKSQDWPRHAVLCSKQCKSKSDKDNES